MGNDFGGAVSAACYLRVRVLSEPYDTLKGTVMGCALCILHQASELFVNYASSTWP